MTRRGAGAILVAAVVALLAAVPASAHEGLGTAASDTLRRMFTQAGSFGPPPYASDPFTCDATTKRTLYYNTTSNTVLVCNGSAWGAVGGGTTFSDATFRVQDDGDNTKQLAFQLSGFTTGTTRTVTVQNSDQTMAATNLNNVFSGNNTYSSQLLITGRIAHQTRQSVTVDGATTFALTQNYVLLACTGAETINTITSGITGMVVYIENTDTECTIADDDDPTAANAIDLTGAAANDVGAVAKVITLIYNGTHWMQTAESDN